MSRLDPALGHDLGLPELLAGDADRPALHLHMGDGHALVGFDVGPQANAVLVKVALVAVEVVLQAVEIDEERGRVEVFYVHSGLS